MTNMNNQLREQVEKQIILDLCGGTGAWSKPYKDAGYDVRVITLPTNDITKTVFADWYIDFELERVPYSDVIGILAAPPCTMFSMARTVAKTPRDLEGAMKTVQACLDVIWHCQYSGKKLQFWALENPKARLRWFLGLPAMTFSPHDYGDAYRKPTDLWGNFNTNLKKNPVELNPEQKKKSVLNVQDLLPIPEDYKRDPNMSTRSIARSITHPGFAQAFFNANKPKL